MYQLDRIIEPLGIEYIGAFVVCGGHDVLLIDQITLTTEETVQRILGFRPDVVGFSCMAFSYPETMRIASLVKRESPQIVTVLGGYHVLGMESCPACFDIVVRGEGEVPFRGIVDAFESSSTLAGVAAVPGIVFLRGQGIPQPTAPTDDFCHAFPRVRPLRRSHGLENMRYFSRNLGENYADTRTACVVLARGSPFRCSFCATPVMYNGRHSARDLDDVLDEISDLAVGPLRTNHINFRDETLYPRAAALDLAKGLLERGLCLTWRAFITPGVLADPSDYRALYESGCRLLFMGAESSDAASLRRMRKPVNPRLVSDHVAMAQAAGIYVRVGFMIGDEDETEERLQAHAAYLDEMCPDAVYISYLTPFPGTPIYADLRSRGRLLSEDLSLYDCASPIIKPQALSLERLYAAREWMNRHFYGGSRWVNHMRRRAARSTQEYETIRTYARHLECSLGVSSPLDEPRTGVQAQAEPNI
ncbi:MAG: radical SAM protein [Phycisphaerae bacterium]